MEHQMILLDADLKTVRAKVVARRKHHAGVAQVAEHGIRIPEGESSNDSTSPNSEEHESSQL